MATRTEHKKAADDDKPAKASGKANDHEAADELAPKAGAALRDVAEYGRERVASALDRAAEDLEARADGAGIVREKAAEYAAGGMHSAAGYLQERDTAELMEEAARYVQANPMRSVAVAVVAGFLAGRIWR